MSRPGRPRRWCGCETTPYGRVDWDCWVSIPDKAWCRFCGRDIRPERVRLLYAVGNAAVDGARAKLPTAGTVVAM